MLIVQRYLLLTGTEERQASLIHPGCVRPSPARDGDAKASDIENCHSPRLL